VPLYKLEKILDNQKKSKVPASGPFFATSKTISNSKKELVLWLKNYMWVIFPGEQQSIRYENFFPNMVKFSHQQSYLIIRLAVHAALALSKWKMQILQLIPLTGKNFREGALKSVRQQGEGPEVWVIMGMADLVNALIHLWSGKS
jgi:hypothetical protein